MLNYVIFTRIHKFVDYIPIIYQFHTGAVHQTNTILRSRHCEEWLERRRFLPIYELKWFTDGSKIKGKHELWSIKESRSFPVGGMYLTVFKKKIHKTQESGYIGH